MESVRREASNLVDGVLEESIIIVNEQQDRIDDNNDRVVVVTTTTTVFQENGSRTVILDNNRQDNNNSDSDNYAITCDVVGGIDVIKSPTIESMSGKSFDDNLSSSDDHIVITTNVSLSQQQQQQQQHRHMGPQETPLQSGDDMRGTTDQVKASQMKETGGEFLQSTEITPVPPPPPSSEQSMSTTTSTTPATTIPATKTDSDKIKKLTDDIPKPKPRSVKASSPDSEDVMQTQTLQRVVTEEAEESIEIDASTVAPVPKPRSQLKTSESFKNLTILDDSVQQQQQQQQTDSISIKSLDFTEETSHTDETSVEASIRSQPLTTATTTTISDDQPTESIFEMNTELPVDGTCVPGERKTSFYIGESSHNVIVKTTPTNLSSDDADFEELSAGMKTAEPTIEATDISHMHEFSVDSEEDNDVFKEYVTIKSSEPATRMRRQSSETRNDLLEEDVIPKESIESTMTPAAVSTLTAPQTASTIVTTTQESVISKTSTDQSITVTTLTSTSSAPLEVINSTGEDDSIREISMDTDIELERPTELDLPLEKSEWETNEKEIPPPGKSKIEYSPQQATNTTVLTKDTITEEMVAKTLEEVQESLDAAKNELKSVLKDGKSIKESPSEFEFRTFSQTLASAENKSLDKFVDSDIKTDKIIEETMELVENDDISSFIGVPENVKAEVTQESKTLEGLFASTVPESLNRAAAMMHYAETVFEEKKPESAGDDRASLGFISTGTDESLEDSRPKDENISLGFVSNETAEEFSSMEDYFQEKFAKTETLSAAEEESAQSLSSFGEISLDRTMKPFEDVVHRSKADPTDSSQNRWSVHDVDQSSSSESYYKSFEKSDSRPLSSDIETLTTQGTSEYNTAFDGSTTGRETTEYMSAVSTLDSYSGKTISSQDSMRSFDSHSETSGNLTSIDSELSETLVASSTDEAEEMENLRDLIDEEDSDESLDLENTDYTMTESRMQQQTMMKRSQEMIFKPKNEDIFSEKEKTYPEVQIVNTQEEECVKPKEAERAWGLTYPVEESKYDDTKDTEDILLYHGDVRRSIDESKYGSSLDEGSVLSVSMSSTSNIDTVMENFEEIIGSVGASSLAGIDGFGASSLPDESTFVMDLDSAKESEKDDSPKTGTPPDEDGSKKGHKRTESLLAQSEDVKSIADKEVSAIVGEGKESESESDTDPYETEYARQFRSPKDRKSKKKKQAAAEMDHSFESEKRPFTPSQLVAEVIVEDIVTEELEAEACLIEERRPSQNMQDYSNIPDITVTVDDTQPKSPILEEEMDTFEEKTLYKVKTQEELHKASDDRPLYQESRTDTREEDFQRKVQEQYKQKLAELQKAEVGDSDYDENKAPDSPDSFEMVDQPDISDEFVIIEEVAKEANEDDLGGKSIRIKPTKYEPKHDEEVEKIIIKSAPADPKLGSQIFRDDLNFEFEESPPTASSGGTGSELQEESDSGSEMAATNKRWVEMQLTDNQLRYPYELTGGVLEDIKEEDAEFEVGSSRISSFKDSFSSTPEYDILAARRYYAQRGDPDDISMSSLQEFESLEQAISLENRNNRTHQGSTDSSSGSFQRRYIVRHSGSGATQGDDISVSSLKEFEGIENACIEAHLIEIKAKEEAALLSRSDESNKSNGSDRSTAPSAAFDSSNVVLTKVTRTVTHTEVLPTGHQSADIEALLKQKLQECEQKQLSTQITQILESRDKADSDRGSIDSFEMNRSGDITSASADESFDMSRDGTTKSDIDSIEVDKCRTTREESIESSDMQLVDDIMSAFGVTVGDGLTTTTTTTTTSTDEDGLQHTVVTRRVQTTTSTTTGGGFASVGIGGSTTSQGLPSDISAESLNQISGNEHTTTTSSSGATMATYQTSAGNSQMSGSVTSCASSTLMEDSTTSLTSSQQTVRDTHAAGTKKDD